MVCLPEDRATQFTHMKLVKVGMLLPHEIVASLWSYSAGELFYAMMAGTPSASCPKLMSRGASEAQDLCQYWDRNKDLERSIRARWEANGIEPVEDFSSSCVPLRLYGDGAEMMSAGLRAFDKMETNIFRCSICGALQHGLPPIHEQKQPEYPNRVPCLQLLTRLPS